MTTQTEALKLALDRAAPTSKGYVIVPDDAFQVIKEALAQPEQEPVAWLIEVNGVLIATTGKDYAKGFVNAKPLYTTPPQRKPWVSLSDEDIERIAKKARSKDHAITLAQRELKEKNT